MTQGIETGVGDVFQARQATAGTIEPPDAINTKRLRKAGDDGLKAAKTTAQEEYVDGQSWSNAAPYVDSIGGDVGTLTVQGQISVAAFLWAQLLGSDVVTGSADPYAHTITSGVAVPVNNTIRIKTGSAIGPVRQAWYDAKISKLTQNVGQSQKTMHLAEDIKALHAAETYMTDPTAADGGDDPLRWGECVTKINGTALEEIGGDTIEADAKLDVYRGQTPAPVCFVFGKGSITRTLDGIVTDGTIPLLNQALYGTSTPADAAPVSNQVGFLDIVTLYTRSASRTLQISTPKVEVQPNDWILGPKAEGGTREVAFGGLCHTSGGSPQITIVAKTGDATAYV